MQEKDLFSMLRDVCMRVFVYGSAHRDISPPEEEMNNRGVTLIELIIVISIIGIMATGLGFSYVDWIGNYKVEKAANDLYADLMNARSMAMTRNSNYFMDFNFPAPPAGYGVYRIAEDTNGDCEGDDNEDGIIDAAGHTFSPSFPKTVEYPITNNFTNKIINFDKKGLVQPEGQGFGGTICFFTDHDPDYDCIVIFKTRIIMGKLISKVACKAENCLKK